ncbi:Neuroglian [Portunus trituberculatus]|uniref:Neuroglian n=1 Tax=Portunus trituberculatus TaxID=210409 RepID=A0A5B7IZD1_PORTR|nr:Neuroglian [Portunus trituberculatus]
MKTKNFVTRCHFRRLRSVFISSSPPSGSYQCVAENQVGKAFSDIVSVRRAVMAYVPKQEPRVVTATLGRPLRLDCDVPAGHPMPSVQWFRQAISSRLSVCVCVCVCVSDHVCAPVLTPFARQTNEGKLSNMNSSRVTQDERGSLWFSHVALEDASQDALYACAAFSAAR